MRASQRFMAGKYGATTVRKTSMTNEGEQDPGRPVPGRSAFISSCLKSYNNYDASQNDAVAINVKRIYTKGNNIFIGLDTCANVHSVPYLPWLSDPQPTDRPIGTSGGGTSARSVGSFAFMVDLFNENKQKGSTFHKPWIYRDPASHYYPCHC